MPATQLWSHWMAIRTAVGVPTTPARTASRRYARCGAQRPFWFTASSRPAASAVAKRPAGAGFRGRRRGPPGRSWRPSASSARLPGDDFLDPDLGHRLPMALVPAVVLAPLVNADVDLRLAGVADHRGPDA